MARPGRHDHLFRTSERRDAHRERVRELHPARGMDAHGTGRKLRRVRLEQCQSGRAQPLSQRDRDPDARTGVAQPAQEGRRDAAGRLCARRALRRERCEDRAGQPARPEEHVHRKPLQRAGRVEHLRRGGGGWRDEALGQRQVCKWLQPLDAEERISLPGVGRGRNPFSKHSDHGTASGGPRRGCSQAVNAADDSRAP